MRATLNDDELTLLAEDEAEEKFICKLAGKGLLVANFLSVGAPPNWATFRLCNAVDHHELREQLNKVISAAAVLVDALTYKRNTVIDDELGVVDIGPSKDFGCVHHEEKTG